MFKKLSCRFVIGENANIIYCNAVFCFVTAAVPVSLACLVELFDMFVIIRAQGLTVVIGAQILLFKTTTTTLAHS